MPATSTKEEGCGFSLGGGEIEKKAEMLRGTFQISDARGEKIKSTLVDQKMVKVPPPPETRCQGGKQTIREEYKAEFFERPNTGLWTKKGNSSFVYKNMCSQPHSRANRGMNGRKFFRTGQERFDFLKGSEPNIYPRHWKNSRK